MSLSDLDKVRYDSNYSSSMYDSNTTLKFVKIEKTYRYDKAQYLDKQKFRQSDSFIEDVDERCDLDSDQSSEPEVESVTKRINDSSSNFASSKKDTLGLTMNMPLQTNVNDQHKTYS